jgi:type I restriction enzyme M protein
MSSVERSRIDSEKNFLDVLDKVQELSNESIDQTHVFTLSQVYEGLLLKMGEKGNDSGQFFTPRDTIRVMIRAVNPQIGKTIYDPGCGTGGFLAQAYEYMREEAEKAGTLDAKKLETLKRRTFYGREKDDSVYPIALANLILHGIDEPHIWHGNTLSGQECYGELFKGAPQFFDYVLMNPPFGGKEGKEAQTFFDLPHERHAGSFHSARPQEHEGRKRLRNCSGRRRFVPDERRRLRPDEAEAAR